MEEQTPFERSSNFLGENTSSAHMTSFMDHKEGEGIYINP